MAEPTMESESASNPLCIHIDVLGHKTSSQRPSIITQVQAHKIHHREDYRPVEDTHSICILCYRETYRSSARRNN